jgi:uncharacterized protein YggU (UPF0235/DUF167 family)
MMPRVTGITFGVHLKPGNPTNQVLTAAQDEQGLLWLEVGVVPRPINGAANSALIALFAKELRLPKSAVKVIAGETARLKRLHIRGDAALLTSAIMATAAAPVVEADAL